MTIPTRREAQTPRIGLHTIKTDNLRGKKFKEPHTMLHLQLHNLLQSVSKPNRTTLIRKIKRIKVENQSMHQFDKHQCQFAKK